MGISAIRSGLYPAATDSSCGDSYTVPLAVQMEYAPLLVFDSTTTTSSSMVHVMSPGASPR